MVHTGLDHRYKHQTETEINRDPNISPADKTQPQRQNPWRMGHDRPGFRGQAQRSPANLILETDLHLWDGKNTIDDVPEADQQLPSKAEINNRVKYYTDNPSQQEDHSSGNR
ncbi:hypothetical protein VP01_1559g3 [Puccinia sorghi]|uniref:Uncharacterized protein n=1 Tax=Puccinia sorghi TaxID=27349 RepID=A0A0L6VI29_9BASI|nr:hypothetical protein VP01_1559g3 [Puccinia sorghi]